ncbi:MAG: carbohydrate-binding protein [Acidobacteria bacterium]|nr:carbohydrate-binding protein [Acidobacteriota bacterium]
MRLKYDCTMYNAKNSPSLSLIANLMIPCLLLLAIVGCNGVTPAAPAPPPAIITWATPAPVITGTPLSATQLDATANTAGTFVYTPALGTVLPAGTQILSVVFTPSNTFAYGPAKASVALSVTAPIPVPPVITWPAPSPINAGVPLSATQLNATANTQGTFVYTPAAGTVLSAGTHTLSATFTPTYTANFSTVTVTNTITVNTAPSAVITWPAPANIVEGTPLTATQLDATANTPGTFAYTPALGTVLPLGQNTLSVTFTPANLTLYSIATATVSLTVVTPAPPAYQSVRIVGGGFVTGIVAHPTQKDLRYARTDIGGAYRWDASQSQWTPITDFISRSNSNNIGIESIGLDPSDPQRLYLAVGTYADSFGQNGAFLLSDDQGSTFTTVAAPFKMGSNDNGRYDGERLSVDPNLGTTLYFGSRLNGLWKSIDRGLTWNQVTSFPVTGPTSGVGVVFEDFVASSGSAGTATPVIYVGVSDTGAAPSTISSLYRSIDSGATWQVVPNQPTGLYPSHGVFGLDGALYLSYGNGVGPSGVSSGQLWKYTPTNGNPGGAGTWTNITPTAPAVRPSYSQGGFGAIAIDPERPGVLMASTMDDYYPGDDIYRSQDYGNTWVSLEYQLGAVHDVTLSPWLTFGGSKAYTGNWPGTLVIDPFNSDHVMYGTGQTIWDSTDMNLADSSSAPTFTVGALGIEETAVLALISPTAGANLVSGVGDIGGFVHTSFTASPAGGMSGPPIFGNTTGLDFAQASPSTIVRVGSTGNPQKGAYSLDGGTTWAAFATLPAGTTNGQGAVAISPNGTTIVWATQDAPVAYSTTNGATWTASAGAPQNSGVLSDRVNNKKFYIYNSQTGAVMISQDSGATFTLASTQAQYGSLYVSYAAEGDLWLATGNGLLHSTDSGSTFQSVPGLTAAYAVGFGMAAPGMTYPALYAIGSGGSGYGFYRSIDGGATWLLVSDPQHQYGYVGIIIGDPRVYGRFYLGTGGRGIIYADTQ